MNVVRNHEFFFSPQGFEVQGWMVYTDRAHITEVYPKPPESYTGSWVPGPEMSRVEGALVSYLIGRT